MRTWCLCILAVAFLILLSSVAFAAPAIEFEKTVVDFGKITTGYKGKAEFTFKNTGDQPLNITKITAICKCTTVVKPTISAIAPGKSEKVVIVFDSTGFQGEVIKRIMAKSNDPAHEKTLLTITADVQPIAKLAPESINFGFLKPGEKYNATITLTPMTAKPFKIVKIEQGKCAKITDFKPLKDGKGSYKLNLLVSAGKLEERVMDDLRIITDLPGRPSVSLMVFGNVNKGENADAGAL